MKLWKKNDIEDDEDMVLDLDEFDELEEEDAKKKELTIEEYEKNFIFHIERGCPICRSDVKGNDHYRYFCSNCNILFEKHDIMEKDFGKHSDEGEKVHLRVVPLTEEQKAELQDRKKALMEKIKSAFGDEESEEKQPVSAPAAIPAPGEGWAGPAVVEAEFEEVQKDEEDIEPETEDVEEPVPEPEETPDRPEETAAEPEYELEDESKVIASKESNRIHKGTCHFIRKINPENRIYFESIGKGEEKGYELCVCLRRLIAQKKAEEKGEPVLEGPEGDAEEPYIEEASEEGIEESGLEETPEEEDPDSVPEDTPEETDEEVPEETEESLDEITEEGVEEVEGYTSEDEDLEEEGAEEVDMEENEMPGQEVSREVDAHEDEGKESGEKDRKKKKNIDELLG
ncbi:TPA: hypothetical protein HA265_00905 [Candidatus Woesearchaeota archaeon]|nr:hypothetical protein [Candidatus Woesearchaeota archaeon]